MAYNYYPNPYMNYGQNSYSYMQQPSPQPIQPVQQYPMISGKLVESIEVMNAQETPIGGYSVFPLVDFSKVYIKAYDKDGTLQVFKYDLVKPEEVKKTDLYSDKLDDIYTYIGKIEKKIDGIKLSPSSSPTAMKKRKQEVDEDDA